MGWPYKPAEKWDVHTHTTTSPETYDSLARFTRYADFIRIRAHDGKPCCAQMVNARGEVQRVIEDNAYDGAARLKDCDAHGVTVQVLSPTPMMIPDYVDDAQDAADICRILNDDNAATVAKFPGRFVAIGAVPLRFPDLAIKEMERIKKEHDMRGIEINSNVNGADLDDAAFFPVFEAAEKLGMAIFIHPWGGFMMPGEDRLKKRMNPARNWRPWLVGMGMETALAFDALRSGRVHERLPKLRVLYAHGGGGIPALLGRLEHGAYCRPDLFAEASKLDPYKTVRECGVYVDTLVHHPALLGALIDMLGAERIALGSDYPYPLGEIDPFDPQTLLDPKGNRCPYPAAKGIYPGYTVEHLPDAQTKMEEALSAFPWVAGLQNLPRVSDEDKQRMLSGTAKEWLGYA
ncbi:MAG: amidohydrolase family protein [Alphaproteobacteria bacterium]|nr:amidohydrolase family protein [Alphaproteobacteria bacterium]